jgi:hypothetical protein
VAIPLREYTPRELARLIEQMGYTVEPARREAFRVTGPGVTWTVFIPNAHGGRRLRKSQVRLVLRELGIAWHE